MRLLFVYNGRDKSIRDTDMPRIGALLRAGWFTILPESWYNIANVQGAWMLCAPTPYDGGRLTGPG